MISVKLCPLAVLVVIALFISSASEPTEPIEDATTPELMKSYNEAVEGCAKEFSIGNTKEAMEAPTPENGCFYKCIKDIMTTQVVHSGTVLSDIYVTCVALLPKFDEPCQNAYEIKKCMANELKSWGFKVL